MNQGYPSFPSWDEAQPAGYAPPPAVGPDTPQPVGHSAPQPVGPAASQLAAPVAPRPMAPAAPQPAARPAPRPATRPAPRQGAWSTPWSAEAPAPRAAEFSAPTIVDFSEPPATGVPATGTFATGTFAAPAGGYSGTAFAPEIAWPEPSVSPAVTYSAAQAPVYPVTQPGTYPAVEPTYPAAQPTYPAAQPAYPSAEPAYPGAQPAYPAAQPAYGAASISVTMRFAPIAFLFGIFKPVLTVDGQRIRAAWKRRVVVPVNPGSHLVHAHAPWLIPPRAGKADLPVDLAPGETLSLEYRAPVISFMRGALGPGRQRYPGMAAAITINTLAVAGLLAAGFVSFVSLRPQDGFALPADAKPSPAASQFEAPVFPVAPTGPAVPTFPESSKSAGGGTGLREDAPDRKVVGATFDQGEDTSTAAPSEWPFAFRIPGDWNCVPGKIDLPKTDAVVCFDKATEKAERAGIILRTCPSTCDAADRRALDKDWFVDTTGLKRADDLTKFRQTARNDDGRYQLELSHYFTDPASGVKYQVGVDARTDPAQKATAQKVVNDILSQTTF